MSGKQKIIRTLAYLFLAFASSSLLRLLLSLLISTQKDLFSGFSGLALGLVIADLLNIASILVAAPFVIKILKLYNSRRPILATIAAFIVFLTATEVIFGLPSAEGLNSFLGWAIIVAITAISLVAGVIATNWNSPAGLITRLSIGVVILITAYGLGIQLLKSSITNQNNAQQAEYFKSIPFKIYYPSDRDPSGQITLSTAKTGEYKNPKKVFATYKIVEPDFDVSVKQQLLDKSSFQKYIKPPKVCRLHALEFRQENSVFDNRSCLKQTTPAGNTVYMETLNGSVIYSRSFFAPVGDCCELHFQYSSRSSDPTGRVALPEISKLVDSMAPITQAELKTSVGFIF